MKNLKPLMGAILNSDVSWNCISLNSKACWFTPPSRPCPSLSFYPVKKGILTKTYFLDKETQKCILVISGLI